ncbi:MAG: YdcF family protein [Sulfurimonas sp.]|nr:YdcF family protein [Sulfurimonas sp.]
MVKKISYLSILFIITFSIAFINLGKFFDITEPPKKTDIIVCLGGGASERIKKTLELYLKGYSKSKKIILTGSTSLNKKENKITFLTRNGVPRENIIFLKDTSNTMKEVLILKNYLLQNNMKSVMFVTDPPHSRRIVFLANTIAKYKYYELSCLVVGSEVAWWNKDNYYENNKAVRFVISEMLKLPFNYIAYGILKPLGLYDLIREHAGDFIYFIKFHMQKALF